MKNLNGNVMHFAHQKKFAASTRIFLEQLEPLVTFIISKMLLDWYLIPLLSVLN